MHDDLGHPIELSARPTRVVSLVPSLTEAIAATAPDLLVGATDWCTHPAELEVARVRGTKNPNLNAIVELAPDLVIANQEENRELDVRRLRERGIKVWVTRIETVPEAITAMRRLFVEVLDVGEPEWLVQAAAVWAESTPAWVRAAVPIWRDPWMVVGRDTFTGDLLARLGVANGFADAADRYPAVQTAEIELADLDLVILPDEPYVFTADDGPEAFATPSVLVEGRLLTWYGPSLVTARATLTEELRRGVTA
ncbi:helical backbone metal receptor [Nocardioides sp. Bht2]|uniref:helical backbone metal receptor n=1 Tax=Nocardioides sp. Bht2 TaxID=3392297 RepID=UPI0039B6C2B9